MICISVEELCRNVDIIREGKKVVLATGSFDILHVDHLIYLEGAKSEGDILVVAVKSDKAVGLKNPDRPINTGVYRVALVDRMKPVDFTIIVDYDDSIELEVVPDNEKQREWLTIFQEIFKKLKPDILYYEGNTDLQSARDKVFEKYGITGIMKIRGERASTTEIIKKIKGK